MKTNTNTSSQIHSTPSLIGRVRGGSVGGLLSHSFALIREDKLFSAIYIAGTAVAIASAMVVAIMLNIKMANIYPERHRNRTLYVSALQYKDNEVDGPMYTGSSTLAVDELFSKLECVEVATGFIPDYYQSFRVDSVQNSFLPLEGRLRAIYCDPRFFQLYDFQFLEGRPFNEQEFRNGEPVCVVTDKFLEKIGVAHLESAHPHPLPKGGEAKVAEKNQKRNTSGNESPSLGEGLGVGSSSFIYINSIPYRIIGIVKSASPMMDASYAEFYAPWFGKEVRHTEAKPTSYKGNLSVRVLLKKGYSREDFLKEVEPLCRRYEAAQSSAEGEPVHFTVDAKSHFFVCFSFFHSDDESTTDKAKNLMPPAILMLIFLLLPALNLSGLISNRMEARRAEMGIRKAFGAKRRWLLREVIGENLVLTCCGGLVGWVLSWLFYLAVRHTAMFQALILREGNLTADITLDFNMFVTPTLFLIVFLCCVVLNLMVALIPSWTSLRKPIVESLNQKK
ncbi:MAG: FtsX-like permease family protein [Bacteroidaceae bacterium]|nr:FtsX-like permease family protein [Bacteroidaceae bacterium]